MLVYTISIADRYVLSTLLKPISDELHLTDKGAASLGIPLALFYVTMGIPLSWLTDRVNRVRLLSACIVIWSAMTTLCGFTRGYFDLLLARIGVGIGEAGGTPACNALVADYFPAHRRAMATTIFALGAPIGAWLGSDIAGSVSAQHGWRWAFLVLGAPGIVLAIVLFFTIREPERGCLDKCEESDAPTLVETLKFLWSQKAAVHGIMGAAVSALWGWGLMWFTPLFLQRTYGMDEGVSGGMLGNIYLWAGIGASLLTAWALGRPYLSDPRRMSRFLAIVTGLATIPSFLAYYTRDLYVAQIMFWLFIPAIYFYLGPAFAMCQNLAPPKMRAMCVAISLLIANVFNLIVAPAFVGTLSDFFAGAHAANADSLRLAQLFLAPTGFWAAWHYWMTAKYIVADQKRAIGYV
jgi:predicted MFS family arabinose efflux permease